MAGEWQPITRGKPEVEGIDPDASGLLIVTIPLEPEPDHVWAQFFTSPVGVEMSFAMHAPEISYRSVRIRTPDAELEQYVAHVDERIRSANERYEREVLPELKREREAADAAAADEASRLDAARRRAEDL